MNKRKLTHIRWDITTKCNLNCVHCYAANLYPYKNDLPLDKIKQIIDNMQNPGVEAIAFYGGEPLIRNDIVDIIAYCTRKEIQSMVVTNGLLLEEVIDQLVGAGLSGVAVSLDGATSQTYEKIRGNVHFDKIVKSFKRLSDLGIKHRAINTVIMRENVHETEQFIRLASECKATSLNFDGLGIEGNVVNFAICSTLTPEEIIHFSELVIETLLKNKLPVNYAGLPFNPPVLLEHLNKKYNINLPIISKIHLATIDGLFVDAYGKSYACKGTHSGFTMKGKDFHQTGISLVEHTLAEVLQSNEFEELYYKMNPVNTAIHLSPCNKCKYYQFQCNPCPISAANPEKRYAESCINFPIGQICEILFE